MVWPNSQLSSSTGPAGTIAISTNPTAINVNPPTTPGSSTGSGPTVINNPTTTLPGTIDLNLP
jgi:hypothetical protein